MVPGATIPWGSHTGSPVEQEMRPLWQGCPGGVHVMPARQVMQAPRRLHTRSVPQVVPGARVPARMQVAVPVAQVWVPMAQGSDRVQVEPGAQATQVPVGLQTLSTRGDQR